MTASKPPIRLISTDFDGTLHNEFAVPPVPESLQRQIAELQAEGASWIINTGRDRDSLLESLKAAKMLIQPDYLILVEREIYERRGPEFFPWHHWNDRCTAHHESLFSRFAAQLDQMADSIRSRYSATVYADAYSPVCLIAKDPEEANVIVEHMESSCRSIPELTIVRNHIYARLSHMNFNKGTAMSEVASRLRIPADHVFAAGDHLNDLPMLDRRFAGSLAAPANAVDEVKQTVRRQGGWVSEFTHGAGVADALERITNKTF